MYVRPNYKTKKEFLNDFKAGKRIEAFSPGFFPINPNGNGCVEGPHYPQPHRWYSAVTLRDGVVIAAK